MNIIVRRIEVKRLELALECSTNLRERFLPLNWHQLILEQVCAHVFTPLSTGH